MGVYDTIVHKMPCPYCGKDVEIVEQIKWAKCLLRYFKTGDEIDAADGEYDYATSMRPELVERCDYCHKEFHYKVIVKDGILAEIKIDEAIKQPFDIEVDYDLL